MADETSTAAASNTGTPPDTKADADTDKGTQTEKPAETAKTFSQEEVTRIVAREVRKAEEKAKAELEKAQTDAKKSLEEKLQSENDSLKSQLRERDARDDFIREAGKLKSKPRSASALFELGKSRLEFNKEGRATNIKDVLSDLQEEYSELFGIDKQTINAGEPDGKPSDLKLYGVDRMRAAYDKSAANSRR